MQKKTSEIIYREDLYPRIKPSPKLIQEYADNIESLPPIEINQHNILIDGYHRWKAHETLELKEIECKVIETKSEMELLKLAVAKNSKFGLSLTREEKKKYAVQWWQNLEEEEILKTLSISRTLFYEWTKDKRKQQEEEQRQRIHDLWLSCHIQEEIAAAVGIPQQTVADIIADFTEKSESGKSGIFRNFEPEIYSVWNFAKNKNEAKVFGSIPQEIIDNLLYYFTKPYQIIFDPFGGGGSTIDKCIERNRRYYVSDLSPIPARNDIRQHDITTGLPNDLPVPDFVFLDPPYWKQAEKKYSSKKTDLGNIDLEDFLTTIGNIARDIKRKWGNKKGKLAIIIGEYKNKGAFVDLPFLCYERITKYLKPVRRIYVPYSTQIHGGAFVNMAKEKKEILYLGRDLMVFEK